MSYLTIKTFLKRNKHIYFLIKIIRKIQYVIIPYIKKTLSYNTEKYLRLIGIRKNHYTKLKHLKNKHIGERCFIVATGPSLTIEDLNALKNEITFGMNSICLAFDDTEWRPTYYGIQAEDVYLKLEEHINRFEAEGKFISNTIFKKINIDISKNVYIFPLNMLHHNFFPEILTTKFSKNIFLEVFSGFTITYSLLQIAVYMGFKEIYLVGLDCNYTMDMKHHFKEYGIVDPEYLKAGERMISSFKIAKKYADRNNIKIFNATRGGMLEVFERVDLDEVISTKNYYQN